MNTTLTEEQYWHLVEPRPHLWWGTEDKKSLSVACVVEGILGWGNWDDVKMLIRELGIQQVKQIFESQTSSSRTNYRPQTIHFFRLYFNHHA
jgi:hypothetical protein